MIIIARIAVIILVFIKNNLSFTTTNSGTEKSSADFCQLYTAETTVSVFVCTKSFVEVFFGKIGPQNI